MRHFFMFLCVFLPCGVKFFITGMLLLYAFMFGGDVFLTHIDALEVMILDCAGR